jgi:regulator of protease activity HflC (stomatin/prohibitin superfamily)
MLQRLKTLVQAIRDAFSGSAARLNGITATAKIHTTQSLSRLSSAKRSLVIVGLLGTAGYLLYSHPPLQPIGRGEVGIRVNQLTGGVSEWRDGSVLVVPGLHEIRVFSLRDQTYRPTQLMHAQGSAPVQSVEGLSLGVDLSIRYALDATKLSAMAKNLPDNVCAEIVEPAVSGVIYKIFARYTVREIFSTKRAEIQQAIEAELKPKLAADGVVLRAVQLGKVDLPADYKRGMEGLLAEELASEKMRYTLELKDKRVKETELDGIAETVRREKSAEAAAREQIIAAKGQEEAMKHVLPLKQRQIEQRLLEAEAEKVARVRGAEGNAQARRIEANGEGDARQRLADAEAYRIDRVGKVNAEQMGREGALLTRHPLLVQKTMADKLSDKVQVIIAPPPADGGFIGATLLGANKVANGGSASTSDQQAANSDGRKTKEEE